ncbi:MAG: PQQ-binding-like beta-propeller repeat protein [bacterium]
MKSKLNKRFSEVIVTFWVCILISYHGWHCRSIVVISETKSNPTVQNWNLFGGTPQRVNYREKTLLPPLKFYWEYKASSAISPTLVAVDGILYFATLDGRIYALNIESAKRIGRNKSEENNEATCAYYRGNLIIASRYGDLTLSNYNLDKGKYLWKIDAGDIASEPLVADGGIFISALYNHIDKYHFGTGEKLWTFKTEDQHRSSPALSKNILVVGCDNGMIYGLNANSGKMKWKYKTGASVFATPTIWDETVFVGSSDSTFYALNLSDGSVLWTFRANDAIIQSSATDGNKVVFGSNDGQIYCLNVLSGQEQWRFQAKSVVSTPPLISGKVLYFGSLDSRYYCLSLENGNELWQYETKGRIRTAPIVWGNYLLGASEDKYIYAFIKTDSIETD